LEYPFVFIGLDRTNNYIANLHIGMPFNGRDHVKMWTPIIPNSQLLFYPNLSTSKWILDVFVKPTSNAVYVVIATAIILVLLGLVIVYYHYKEK